MRGAYQALKAKRTQSSSRQPRPGSQRREHRGRAFIGSMQPEVRASSGSAPPAWSARSRLSGAGPLVPNTRIRRPAAGGEREVVLFLIKPRGVSQNSATQQVTTACGNPASARPADRSFEFICGEEIGGRGCRFSFNPVPAWSWVASCPEKVCFLPLPFVLLGLTGFPQGVAWVLWPHQRKPQKKLQEAQFRNYPLLRLPRSGECISITGYLRGSYLVGCRPDSYLANKTTS